MQQMTRPEFEAYERRVESALSSMERSLDESERASFEEIAAAAREVIGIRREHVELSERKQLEEAERRGITPEYYLVSEEQAARFGVHDAAIAHGTYTLLMDISQELEFARREDRDTAALEREEADAIRIAGELAASGNQSLRDDADRWPELREAIHVAEARQVIDELATARQVVDDARREMNDTDLVDEDLAMALSKGVELALNGNQHIRDYAEGDPQLNEWIDRGLRESADRMASQEAEGPHGEPVKALDEQRDDATASRDLARAKAQELLVEIAAARDLAPTAPAGELSELKAMKHQIQLEKHQSQLDSALWKAAVLTVNKANQYLREAAEKDQVLHDRIAHLEKRDASLIAGRDGLPVPDVARGDAEMLGAYELGLAKFKSDLVKGESGDTAHGRASGTSETAWAEFGQLEQALRTAREPFARRENDGSSPHEKALLGYANMAAALSPDNSFAEAITRHGEQAVREGNKILADLDVADAAFSYATNEVSRAGWSIVRERTTDEYRDVVGAVYRDTLEQYEGVMTRYARAALDGNTYLYELSKSEENLHVAIRDEVQSRQVRYPNLRFRDDHSAERHGEDAVHSAKELFAQIDDAAGAVRDLYQVREERQSGSPNYGSNQAEYDARVAKLDEAESRHDALLQRAAREALDSNSYMMEARNVMPDLNNEIHMESRRREEAQLARGDDAQGVPRQSDRTGHAAARSNDEYRADPPQQRMPRLRQIELELQERRDRERDARER
ncbi:hypothetical protein [Tianweitania sediminis]|uniref:Uncharacterized protein n=1 Tax=Tianweitania sediminis TaxID=1502156 RepID=A0A8J7RL66_9HYPH|nr:hypothetical protein [Tianweitania sediminis]MBP0440426.1 hypothetical protein [Tianweitania sediminis]